MSALEFRNINPDPSDPVESWPFEGIVTAIDRGYLSDWRRMLAHARLYPESQFTDDLREAIAVADDRRAADYLAACLDSDATTHCARELTRYIEASRLGRRRFAELLGTSRSRLSTYESGKVRPSAELLERARRIHAATLVEMTGPRQVQTS